MSEWRRFASREELDCALAAHLAARLGAAIEQHGAASIALSGGSTPKGMFAQLSRQPLDWDRVYVTLVDERWVDADHADSNERLLRENLLVGPAADARFIGLKSPAPSASEGLAASTEQLSALPLPLTCVVLGMGGDGHTASWFPRAANLAALLDPGNPALLGTCDPVTAPHQRITLTLPVVLAAGEIILHITGEEKTGVLAAAAARHYPVAAITEQQANPATIWWAP
ncbi:6-phosphogluconolactonase [Haliea sp. E17]|uniref:6-phosphogluconolactonase n=1 Tax=Haliea sp. E17 TaxID=3401576 RepID=UPI003AB0E880